MSFMCGWSAQARQPVFYQEYGVPDTLDGRFDVIVLHMFSDPPPAQGRCARSR